MKILLKIFSIVAAISTSCLIDAATVHCKCGNTRQKQVKNVDVTADAREVCIASKVCDAEGGVASARKR